MSRKMDAWQRELDAVVKGAAGLPSQETVGSLLGAALHLAQQDGKTVDDLVKVLRMSLERAN